MTMFDEREQAFENLFRHDQDLMFRIRARRDRLAGLWAAGLMGLDAAAADAYARRIVDTDFEVVEPYVICATLQGDLARRGVTLSEGHVRREVDHLHALARRQVMAE